MKRKYYIFSILLIISIWLKIDISFANWQQEKLILIINSHTEDYVWTSDVLEGIFKTINPSEFNPNIYMENFDYEKTENEVFKDDTYYKLIEEKYADKKIDLVITTDFKATNFAIKHQKKLFKNIPIVFSGISEYKAREITRGVDNIAGVVEVPNIEETLKTALNIIPNAKNVYVIHDDTERGKIYLEEIRKAAVKLNSGLNVETFERIDKIRSNKSLRKIEKDNIVIGTTFLEDEKGKTVSMSEIARKASRGIDIPIFYLQESTIGHGVLGGSMLDGQIHGMNTGNLALKILRGEKPSNIGLVEENNSKNIYDYNIMKKFNVSEKMLPKDSIILNKPYNSYEEHKTVIIASSIIIALLLLIVLYLFFNIRKRRQAEKEILLVNDDLLHMKEELELIAYYDEVTKLPNRAMFYHTMNKKLNKNLKEESGAILYLDIDDFKNINDIYGHSFGDLVLARVANRLKSLKLNEKYKSIYRISGDEYIIDLDKKDETYAIKLATDIKNLFLEHFNIENKRIQISVSIGIVLYPRDSTNVEDIFKKAELSMYKAKAIGKNCYKVYEKSMERELAERILLENNLKLALERDEFILNYQPQINLKDKKIIGFESLIRWHSKEYGLVSPMKFIPIAEETGEIIKIGEWIFREACKFSLEINKKYSKRIEVSINISPVQLNQENFIDMIKNIVSEEGVSPEIIGIEVTETALMETFEESCKKLEVLKNMGFAIYLDDFGTGYSSLNYLLKLPISNIKIDKSFVDDMMTSQKGRKIIEQIIKLAHDMELSVVAEGVEVEEQLLILERLNCDIIQGYIFGKPLTKEDSKLYVYENLKTNK